MIAWIHCNGVLKRIWETCQRPKERHTNVAIYKDPRIFLVFETSTWINMTSEFWSWILTSGGVVKEVQGSAIAPSNKQAELHTGGQNHEKLGKYE